MGEQKKWEVRLPSNLATFTLRSLIQIKRRVKVVDAAGGEGEPGDRVFNLKCESILVSAFQEMKR